MVSIDLILHFKTCPTGATTDSLEDTVCYVGIVQTLIAYCESREFKLIEHLAQCMHQKITDSLAARQDLLQSITINLRKISPPVSHVHGGVQWTHHVNYGGAS